jgi:hypothetical protein
MLIGKAKLDPRRGGRVVSRTSLLYERGADPSIDRPAHVRAGSALVSWGGHLAVIQDDACFLAIIDTTTKKVNDVPFPMPTNVRQFDDTPERGNKKLKLDLEAAFLHENLLVALGSGSSPLRERIVLIENPTTLEPNVTMVEAPELYAMLRAERAFAGSELNVEGATTIAGDSLLFFQRGNGAPNADIQPVDATARIALAPFLRYLRKNGPCPPLERVIGWELGEATPGDARLTFTDGAQRGDSAVAFLACAEDSPDAVTDGPVTAVAIGVIDEEHAIAELGLLLDENGAPLLDKAEGLAFDPLDRTRAFVVTDRDDPGAPSQLLEIRLNAGWL